MIANMLAVINLAIMQGLVTMKELSVALRIPQCFHSRI